MKNLGGIVAGAMKNKHESTQLCVSLVPGRVLLLRERIVDLGAHLRVLPLVPEDGLLEERVSGERRSVQGEVKKVTVDASGSPFPPAFQEGPPLLQLGREQLQ